MKRFPELSGFYLILIGIAFTLPFMTKTSAINGIPFKIDFSGKEVWPVFIIAATSILTCLLLSVKRGLFTGILCMVIGLGLMAFIVLFGLYYKGGPDGVELDIGFNLLAFSCLTFGMFSFLHFFMLLKDRSNLKDAPSELLDNDIIE